MAIHRRAVQRVAQWLVDLLDPRSNEHRLRRGILPGLGIHRVGSRVHRIGEIGVTDGRDFRVGELQVQGLLVNDRVHGVQVRGVQLACTVASEPTLRMSCSTSVSSLGSPYGRDDVEVTAANLVVTPSDCANSFPSWTNVGL